MQIELLSGRTSYFSFEEDRYLLMFTAVCIDAFSIRTFGEKKTRRAASLLKQNSRFNCNAFELAFFLISKKVRKQIMTMQWRTKNGRRQWIFLPFEIESQNMHLFLNREFEIEEWHFFAYIPYIYRAWLSIHGLTSKTFYFCLNRFSRSKIHGCIRFINRIRSQSQCNHYITM